MLYSPLVITGLHHMSNTIDLQLIATYGTTNLWPMIALSNIAQGSAVLAVILLHRGNKKEEQVSIPSMISAYLGVTEPAMFGINLKYIYPFVAAMIGSGFAGMFSNLMGVRANAIGVGGLPGLLAINGTEGGGWLAFTIAMVIAVVVPIFLTVFFEKQGIFNKTEEPDLVLATSVGTIPVEKTVEEMTSSAKKTIRKELLFAPGNGTIVALDEVQDPVFSKKIMGDGFALRPTDGKIYAPVKGKVISIFETKHAIGILTPNGAEILIHMGLDTVELKGEPFTVRVSVGEEVTPSTVLAEMDLLKVKAAKKETDVVVVMTNGEKMDRLILSAKGEVKSETPIGELFIYQE